MNISINNFSVKHTLSQYIPNVSGILRIREENRGSTYRAVAEYTEPCLFVTQEELAKPIKLFKQAAGKSTGGLIPIVFNKFAQHSSLFMPKAPVWDCAADRRLVCATPAPCTRNGFIFTINRVTIRTVTLLMVRRE